MNALQPPPADPAQYGAGPGDVDGLLTSFFRHELPEPWPAAPHVDALPFSPRRPLLRRSRLALAASVGFLLAGNVLLSDFFDSAEPGKAGTVTTGMQATETGPRSRHRTEEPAAPKGHAGTARERTSPGMK